MASGTAWHGRCPSLAGAMLVKSASSTLLRTVRPAALRLRDAAGGLDPAVAVLYLPAASRDRSSVRDRLTQAGATVTMAADPAEVVRTLSSQRFSVVVIDLAGGDSALATIRVIRSQFPQAALAGVMDPGQPEISAEAVHAGVTNILPWPCEDRDAMALMAVVRDRTAVNAEGHRGPQEELLAYSPAMCPVADGVRAAAARRSPALITGEPGTGRELIARFIHALDDEYVDRPFIRVDCDALGASDLERHLFGVRDPGADIGPDGLERVSSDGAIVRAQGGTLLLAHVEEAPARVQARLARLLRDREAHSSDAGHPIQIDIRVLASSGSDVEGFVADGRLRRDLVERLSTVRIDMPQLARRREDIPMLAALFLRRVCDEHGLPPKQFSRAALTLLAALPWKGNARELQGVVAKTVHSTQQPLIQLDDVLLHVAFEGGAPSPASSSTLRQARAQFEREWISATLARHHGRVGEAARALGIQRTNLYRKVRQLKVPRSLMAGRR